MKLNKDFFLGLSVGFGTGLVFRALVDKDRRNAEGISKELIRVSLETFEKLKEGLQKMKENLEDMSDEVRHEMQSELVQEELRSKSNEPHIKKVFRVKTQ